MTFLLYIGKNKDFLRKFSKLENVQMIYAQNYQDADKFGKLTLEP